MILNNFASSHIAFTGPLLKRVETRAVNMAALFSVCNSFEKFQINSSIGDDSMTKLGFCIARLPNSYCIMLVSM